MSRVMVWIGIVVLLLGGMVLLSRKDTTKPLAPVEKPVAANALAH